MFENVLNSPFLSSLTLTLLHFLWQGTLVAVVLKSALFLFNHSKPQLRYALATLAMLVNLILPIITFVIVYRLELSSLTLPTDDLALIALLYELNQPDVLFGYNAFIEQLPLLLPYVAILWLVTITLLTTKLLIEVTTVNSLLKNGIVPPDAKLQKRFDQLAQQISLTIAPKLLLSIKVNVPMAIGWLKPVVLLPANMVSGLSNAQLEMLILHELAHIRRHDYLVNFLQSLVELLLFFHPGVSWISKQMRIEREYCSDDIAVQHCGDAIAYAHTLADTVSLCTSTQKHTIPDLAIAASGGDLKQRVIRLVDHHCATNNHFSKWFASTIIIFSILLLSSKQLLTMPALEIWHHETPWQQVKKTYNKQTILAELPLDMPSLVNKYFSNISIAKHLLTPSQLTSQQHENTRENLLAKKLKSTEQAFLSATLTPNQAQIYFQEPALTQLDSMQFNVPVSELFQHKISMVEQAFDLSQINHHPLRQTLAQLTTIATHNTSALPNERKLNELNKTNTTAKEPLQKNATQWQYVEPSYPSFAQKNGIEIEAKVNFTIDVKGQIKDIQFPHQHKLNYFKSSIRSAMKQWRFEPAMVDNKPVESQMSKVFSFSLQG